MKVGIPKELISNECRVAAVPETVAKMIQLNMEVIVESGAGSNAYISDREYGKAGASIDFNSTGLLNQSEVILKVQPPIVNHNMNEIQHMKENSILIGLLSPLTHLNIIKPLNEKKITAFSMDLIPRIARAQTMDALSSMSSIAGYKSVIMAADYLGKFFPMLTTAAGTISPAKILVIGAGVAGLQAIATARRLGGVVTAMDTRPIVAEQVKSLGAEFISLEVTHEQAQDAGGYAAELPQEYYIKEQEIIRKHIKDADVVITSAQIPGKRAPVLITEIMVQEMKPGSVIVDLSVEQKGNCALSVPGEIVARHHVTIIGILNVPSTIPIHASYLYAKNIWAFLSYLLPDGKKMKLDMTDEIIKSCLVTHEGETVNNFVIQAQEAVHG